MTSKEFMRKNPFDCKFLIGQQFRCKQEIKWVCEDGQTVINTHCMTVEALADMINGYVENEKLNELLVNGINISFVVTHTSPSFCYKNDKNGIEYWINNDSKLNDDLTYERNQLDLILNKLIDNRI